MGFFDRDYMREPRRAASSVGSLRPQSMTMWIIVINVAVFLLDRLLLNAGQGVVIRVQFGDHIASLRFGPLEYWGHFSELTAIGYFQIWRFITFQFLHANLGHLFFNMLALFFFGPLVENYLGSRRFVPFYLLCGVGGALFYLILMLVGFRIGYPWVPLVGASAGIFGVLIAAAMIAPNATVLLMGMFPMPLRTMVWLFIAMAAYTVLFTGPNAGGEAGHLGGAIVGWLLMQRPQLLGVFSGEGLRRRGGW
jgi:membrane associated rhomboid family serine protease